MSSDEFEGVRLRLWRETLGITQATIAALMNVNERSVRRWEGQPDRWPPPAAVEDVLIRAEKRTRDETRKLKQSIVAAYNGSEPVQVGVFSNDDLFWSTWPDQWPYTSAWHRRIVWNAVQQAKVPVRFIYAT